MATSEGFAGAAGGAGTGEMERPDTGRSGSTGRRPLCDPPPQATTAINKNFRMARDVHRSPRRGRGNLSGDTAFRQVAACRGLLAVLRQIDAPAAVELDEIRARPAGDTTSTIARSPCSSIQKEPPRPLFRGKA